MGSGRVSARSPAGTFSCPLPVSVLFLLCLGWAITGHQSHQMEFSAALVTSECHRLQPGSQHRHLFVNSWDGIPPLQPRHLGVACIQGQNKPIRSLLQPEALQATFFFLHKNLSSPGAVSRLSLLSPSLSVNMASEWLCPRLPQTYRLAPLGLSLSLRPDDAVHSPMDSPWCAKCSPG